MEDALDLASLLPANWSHGSLRQTVLTWRQLFSGNPNASPDLQFNLDTFSHRRPHKRQQQQQLGNGPQPRRWISWENGRFVDSVQTPTWEHKANALHWPRSGRQERQKGSESGGETQCRQSRKQAKIWTYIYMWLILRKYEKDVFPHYTSGFLVAEQHEERRNEKKSNAQPTVPAKSPPNNDDEADKRTPPKQQSGSTSDASYGRQNRQCVRFSHNVPQENEVDVCVVLPQNNAPNGGEGASISHEEFAHALQLIQNTLKEESVFTCQQQQSLLQEMKRKRMKTAHAKEEWNRLLARTKLELARHNEDHFAYNTRKRLSVHRRSRGERRGGGEAGKNEEGWPCTDKQQLYANCDLAAVPNRTTTSWLAAENTRQD